MSERAVLLPNYSKHSTIGASIKEASIPRRFPYLPHALPLSDALPPHRRFLSAKTLKAVP
jgi:hypothetical protein